MSGCKQKILVTILFLTSVTNAFSQKLKFDITLFGDNVGTITIEQKDSAGLKLYVMQSSLEAKVLFTKRSSHSNMRVVFDRDGNLLYSNYKNIKSDGTINTTSVQEGNKLKVEHNGEKSILDGPINLVSVLLYFNEPQKLNKIFSERAGKFFDMAKQEDGTYLAKLDDGQGRFTYKNGKLVQIEVSKGILGTVTIKAVQ